MTNHALNLLARAEKDGEPVHRGLEDSIVVCPHCGGDATYDKEGTTIGICEDCDDRGYLTYPDPMVLITAAQKQGWQLAFHEPGQVSLHIPGVASPAVWVEGPDNQTALTNAMVQATAPLAENRVKCPCVKPDPKDVVR